MELNQKAQELARRRMEEDQQRAREAKQRAWDIEEEDWQGACEAQDTEQKRAIKDLVMAAYTKNVKIQQMWDHVRVDAHRMQEKDYQECCRDELDYHVWSRTKLTIYTVMREKIPLL